MDLGKRFHQVAVIDAMKAVVLGSFRVRRGRAGVIALLERLKAIGVGGQETVVTIEATGNYWNELVGMLRVEKCEVYLVHPKKAHDLRKFYRDHTKTDVTDAEALARMPLVDEKLRRFGAAVRRLNRCFVCAGFAGSTGAGSRM
jgi:transposase